MDQPLIEKISASVSLVEGLSLNQRATIVGAVVDAMAPKAWTASNTIRYGLVAAATGALAVLMEVYHALSGGSVNVELLIGGVTGVVTGIGAIRGRVQATQPIGK